MLIFVLLHGYGLCPPCKIMQGLCAMILQSHCESRYTARYLLFLVTGCACSSAIIMKLLAERQSMLCRLSWKGI